MYHKIIPKNTETQILYSHPSILEGADKLKSANKVLLPLTPPNPTNTD